jgi:3',5'-cyclic AMP phosphodiesterase CpdA
VRSGPAEEPTRRRAIVAISDLHVEVAENRRFVEQLRPGGGGDWLIVCGDVGEFVADIEWGLGRLAERFEKVIWVPGNHELWTLPDDPAQQRGDDRYRHLVSRCRELGVVTPEDPYPVWPGPDGPVVIAPLFTLYDYSFRPNGQSSKRQSLESAYEAGVVCSDELVLFPDPYPSIEEWCRERVTVSAERLAAATADGSPSVLISHFPLLRSPTRRLMHPEFAQWCGTVMTADWHRRFSAVAVVYGHLHIPRTTMHDGVRFEEVSLGYPRQWRHRLDRPALRQILPEASPR